jgi:hypothetical protein
VFTAFVDANLYHDLISGKSVTGIIHCANRPLLISFPNCSLPLRLLPSVQNTLQPGHARNRSSISVPPSATSAFPSNMLRYRRQRVRCQHSFHAPFEAEQTSQLPFLSQKRSCIASVLRFSHIPGPTNPADILSKHWDMPSVWQTLRPFLFALGERRSRH